MCVHAQCARTLISTHVFSIICKYSITQSFTLLFLILSFWVLVWYQCHSNLIVSYLSLLSLLYQLRIPCTKECLHCVHLNLVLWWLISRLFMPIAPWEAKVETLIVSKSRDMMQIIGYCVNLICFHQCKILKSRLSVRQSY